MTDQIDQGTEGEGTSEAQQQQADAGDRNSPAFRAVTEQLKAARAELKAARAAEAERARADEVKAAEEAGKLRDLLAERDRQIAAMGEAQVAAVRDVELRYQLARVFGDDDLRIAGAVAQYSALPSDERPEVAAYVAQLAERYVSQQQQRGLPLAAPAPAGKPRQGAGANDWGAVGAALIGKDKGAALAARRRLEEYVAQHGTTPPGWSV